MVVVSHLFSLFIEKTGRGTAHVSCSSPCSKLSIFDSPFLFTVIYSKRFQGYRDGIVFGFLHKVSNRMSENWICTKYPVCW